MRLFRGVALSVIALALLTPDAGWAQASLNSHGVPSGDGDAIFAVGEGGALEPVAVRMHGAFIDAGSNDGAPPARLRSEANASILTHRSSVNVVFGRRTVARVTATIADGAATIKPPSSLAIGGSVEALASPTLQGHATSARRAVGGAERGTLRTMTALALHVRPDAVTLVNATAIDLGRGTALVATATAKDGPSKKMRNVFLVAEPGGTTRLAATTRATLQNATSVPDTAEMQGVNQELLVDAIDLDASTPAIVTRIAGYDAHTFAIYTRAKTGAWAKVYAGGGVAL